MRRREFLGAVAAGVLLGGCAGEQDPAIPPDADVLNALLPGEAEAARELSALPATDATEEHVLMQDQEHISRLRRAVLALGGDPDMVGTRGGEPLELLARKQQNVFDYVAALPRLADPELRVLVMELAASEAEHLAALRLATGEREPVPDAFAGFTAAAA
jgi:hypothetical protein